MEKYKQLLSDAIKKGLSEKEKVEAAERREREKVMKEKEKKSNSNIKKQRKIFSEHPEWLFDLIKKAVEAGQDEINFSHWGYVYIDGERVYYNNNLYMVSDSEFSEAIREEFSGILDPQYYCYEAHINSDEIMETVEGVKVKWNKSCLK